MKNDVLEANAIPKLNPSDLCTFASAHGEYKWFVSLRDCATRVKDEISRRINSNGSL